jgi:HSP20 family molecular chaperone IbpA
MNSNQQNQQTGQSASQASQQPGQMEKQGTQSSQDSRSGAGQPGQQNAVQAQDQGKGQGSREVSSADPSSRQAKPSQGGSVLLPPVDIFEDESGFTLIADMPGVAKEQLVVRVTGDNLLIEGAATVPVTGNMELVYGEIQSPQYRRSFTLSRELDPGKIEAKLANGVLNLRIPKAEEARPRRIDVSVG